MAQSTPPSAASLKKLILMWRNAEPESFERFLSEFREYTDSVTVAVTEAPPDAVLNMQGRAQQQMAVLRLFAECHIIVQPFNPQQPTP